MFFKKTYTEREIVEGCIANKRFFQEKLYKTHFSAMLRMCLRNTNDQMQAMEIVNTGFLRVFKKLHTFQFKGSLEGWIRRIVYHAMMDYFRKHQKKVHFLVLEDYDHATRPAATDQMYFDDILQMVQELPAQTQVVFRLYAIEGYRHKDIAQKLGISEGTSKWHLSEARRQLKILIQKNNTSKAYAK